MLLFVSGYLVNMYLGKICNYSTSVTSYSICSSRCKTNQKRNNSLRSSLLNPADVVYLNRTVLLVATSAYSQVVAAGYVTV